MNYFSLTQCQWWIGHQQDNKKIGGSLFLITLHTAALFWSWKRFYKSWKHFKSSSSSRIYRGGGVANLLLTECGDLTGEYWPEIAAVWNQHNVIKTLLCREKSWSKVWWNHNLRLDCDSPISSISLMQWTFTLLEKPSSADFFTTFPKYTMCSTFGSLSIKAESLPSKEPSVIINLTSDSLMAWTRASSPRVAYTVTT